MRFLLDTCTFLWITTNPAKLSAKAAALFPDPRNTFFLSAVSAWEVAMLYWLGRFTLPDSPDLFVPQQRGNHGILELPLSEGAALQLPKLPAIHKDPFDRMLVCQALHDNLTILTPDQAIRQYPVPTDW